MSTEAMKRIKSLLQDTKMIDSHTISAVVAECDMALLAQQPATGDPVAWNSIQIASWIGSQLMHEPSMFERATVCKFVRSLGRHPTLIKHSPKTHPAPSVPADVVRDAERGRFLLEWLKRYGLLQAEFGQMGVGEKPENWWLLHAPWGIDKTRPFLGHGKTPEQAIDAAKDAT